MIRIAACSNPGRGLFTSVRNRSTVFFLTGMLLAVLAGAALAGADDPPPPCPDTDGDGFVQCSAACTLPVGKQCGDCDETDGAIFSGVSCAFCSGPGCPLGFTFCVPGSTNKSCPAAVVGNRNETNGFCMSLSPAPFGLTCNPDGSAALCEDPGDLVVFQAEGGSTLSDTDRREAASCSDADDNDCDGLSDLLDPDCQTAEFCDGLDNDGINGVDDGFDVGATCTEGDGECAANGTKVCTADGSDTVCNAVPSAPGVEGPFGSPNCSDGNDNDCDGLTDFPGDASCTLAAEICDGLDNTGEGDIDEGFEVGDSCTQGVGACEATGVKVCSVDGEATVCNAVPPLARVEGPSNPLSCGDAVDNDCDGSIDDADASCGLTDLRVTCALPFLQPPRAGRGNPGRDCNSFHRIVFDEPDGIQVNAELLALTPTGVVMGAIPVENGETTHLASRLSPDDFRLDTSVVSKEVRHTVFAPMPILRVTATDGFRTAAAFCSTIPYLDVMKPSGEVVANNKSATGDEPDVTPVLIALPLVNPASLVVKLDGVDIFAELGKSPMDCAPDTPCSGDISIGTSMVHISDLVVDVAPSLGDSASNSLRMSLTNLGCGGHVLSVSGTKIPGSFPDKVTSACLVDDLSDKGTSFSFEIEITSPANLSTDNLVPTPVEGRVCHGLPIESTTINGLEIFDPANMTVTPPASDEVGAVFEFPIDVELGETNLARDVVFGDHPVGTFDPGSNFVQAAAADFHGNRVFNNSVVFATGETAQPGVGALSTASFALADVMDPLAKAAFEDEVAAELHDAFADIALTTSSTIDVPNAFVAALNGEAITNFFAEKCSGPGPDGKTLQQRFQELADANIRGKQFGPFSAPFPCSCDPQVTLTVTQVDFLTNVACPVLFPGQTDPDGAAVPDDTIRVVIQLPDIEATLSGSDSCRDEFLGVCIAKASASISLRARVSDVRLKFDITESQLEGTTPPSAAQFNAGVSANVDGSLSVHTSVGCIGGDICEALVTVFTFGLVDVTPNIEIDRALDFAREIGQAEPDPIHLREIKLDEEEIENFNQTVRGDVVDVNISPQGIRASLTGRFATNHVDPEVVANPGAFLEMPPTPELPLPLSAGIPQDGAVLVNADSINMMFASLTLSGRLKSECSVSLDPVTGEPRTLGSLLPADCNTLGGPNDTAIALARGFCHGLRESGCETLQGPSFLSTAVEQGTCHGLQGDDCAMIPSGFDGIVLPDNCDSIVIGSADSDNPSRATAISQGRCWGRKGASCETLVAMGGTATDTAVKQGACHGEQGATCSAIPTNGGAAAEIGTCHAVRGTTCGSLGVLQAAQCTLSKLQMNLVDGLLSAAEQGACNLTPSLNVSANQALLFCARQDLPPRFLIRDEPDTDPVEVGLRLNDLSLALVVDRDGDEQLSNPLTATPRCFGTGSVPTGDCTLAALCLDLNFLASFELAADECPADGGVAIPGFKARVHDVQPLSRIFGQVCGGLPAGDDVAVVNQSTTENASIDAIGMNAEAFSPPACIEGLTLGGFVTFEDPTIFAIRTGSPKSVCENDGITECTSSAQCGGGECVPIQNFIGISTRIVP